MVLLCFCISSGTAVLDKRSYDSRFIVVVLIASKQTSPLNKKQYCFSPIGNALARWLGGGWEVWGVRLGDFLFGGAFGRFGRMLRSVEIALGKVFHRLTGIW